MVPAKERFKRMPNFKFPVLWLYYTASEAVFLKAKESNQQSVNKKKEPKLC